MPDRAATHTPPPPPVERPDRIRNVALVGAGGAGKTTLTESLALTAGALTRAGSVPDGTTLADYEEIEHQQQRSVQLSLVPLAWRGLKINIIDTPGYADFADQLNAGLRAAEAAVFVVSAPDQITQPVRALWRRCAVDGIPRAIAVTHLNAARTTFEDVLAMCRDAFGEDHPGTVLPLHLPVHQSGRLCGSVELLTGRLYGEPGEAPDTQQARAELAEAIAGEDDRLMERYLANEELDTKALSEALRREFLQGTLHPVLATAPPVEGGGPVGAEELLDLVADVFPAPTERTDEVPPCDPDAALAAQVIQTGEDPYVGRLSLVRIFSGTLRPDLVAHVPGHGDERITALTCPLGRHQRPVTEAAAGDLVCVAKLGAARTGNTVTTDGRAIEPWPLPEALLPVAVQAHSKADEDRLAQGVAKLTAQDRTLRVEQNPDTHQLVLWCTGDAHQAVVLDRLRARYGVHVDTVPYQVALRETFAKPASGHGRHVKQSGGHGQYAICDLTVEPLPEGGGFEFVDKVVGGAVPRNFIPSVEKGVRNQLSHGVLAGYPMVDVRITLTDGKAHSVDSSDAAFQAAAALALREAAAHGTVRLLEPVDEVEILLPDEYQGAVLNDLSARRGHVLGTEPGGPGLSLVRAEVPELELTRYPVDLRSLAHGTAHFSRTYVRHAPMPAGIAAQYEKAS